MKVVFKSHSMPLDNFDMASVISHLKKKVEK